MKAIDYSWGRPGAKAIRNAGYGAVLRYAPYPGDGGKGLTSMEVAELRSASASSLRRSLSCPSELAERSAGREDFRLVGPVPDRPRRIDS